MFNYDILGRLVKVTDKDNNETTFKYDKVGNLVQKVNFNGVKTEYKYDKLYRLIKLTNINSKGQVISEYNYKLNKQGFRTEVTDNKDRKTEYQYDKCGYLLKEKITNGKNITETNYKYDKVGNRIEKNTNGKTTKYIYDDNNRLISEDDIKYSYDANGNLKKKESKDEIVEFEYNLDGKLSKITKTKGKTKDVESYKYNELGIRIQKNTNGTIINYIVDENTEYPRVLEERDKDGKLLVSYTYGNSLISQNRNTVISVYLKDGLGSTVALTNNKGEVTDTYLYDAFGNIIEKSGETENNYLFAGEQKDKLSGQYYLRARYLDTKIGRFTSMDSYLGSIQDPISLHKYLYANSNPVNYIDPSGNVSLMEQIASTRIYSILARIGTRSISIFVKVNETFIGRYAIEAGQELLFSLADGDLTLEEAVVDLGTAGVQATLGGIDIPSVSKISHVKSSKRLPYKGVGNPRKIPGVTTGGENLSNPIKSMRGSNGNIGLVPKEVADNLRGREFNSFDDFRNAFWQEYSSSSYASEFSKANIKRMSQGLAPKAPASQQYKNISSYVLHHKNPIYNGGGVYDLDNIIISSPRMHQEILDKGFHFNK